MFRRQKRISMEFSSDEKVILVDIHDNGRL